MKFVLRDTDYAIQALLYISKKYLQDKYSIVSVNEIVKELNLPKEHLRGILQILASKKILMSHKGKNGGFSLIKSPDKISLLDIIEVYQGQVDLTHCFLKKEECPNIKKKCKVRLKLKDISRVVEDELKRYMLSSLM